MTYNFLYLVNRICHKLNEVELTSSTFANATGVYADFKESVNAAIADIVQQEDNNWPFLWATTNFSTVIGTNTYTPTAAALSFNWDSFRVKRTPITINTLTQAAGVATATVSAGHQLQTGDTTYISGATQTGYVGNFTVTVTSPTVFTFTVASTTVSPATGSPILYPIYNTRKLVPIDYDAYIEEEHEARDDNMIAVGDYGCPNTIVRTTNNSFIISPKPDRIYTIQYDYFTTPSDLALYGDVPVIPQIWAETIVKGAIYYAYMFRDNIEEAQLAYTQYTNDVNSMRRILIPQPYFMRVDRSLIF